MERGENLILFLPHYIILNIQFSTNIYEVFNETRKYGSDTGGKIEAVPEKDQIMDLLDKDFDSAILNIIKELKETMSKELNEGE